MMTDMEWSLLETWKYNLESMKDKAQVSFPPMLILAAYRELKERREAGYGADRAVAERIRQKSVEGWTPEHDAQHAKGELAIASACYALNKMPTFADHWWDEIREWWPWHPDWDKREKHDRERSLEIAAALIMAELDRINEKRKKQVVGGYLREGKR